MRIQHVEYRIDQQIRYSASITHAYDNLTRVESHRVTKTRIKTRLEAVKEQWDTFKLNHDALTIALAQLSSSEQRQIKQRSYYQHDKYGRTYETYLETIEKMSTLLERLCESEVRPQSATSNSQLSTQMQMYHGPRLPRIDISKFNGNLSDWLPFRDLFSSLVLTNPTISAVEKLQYLKTSLTGSASHLLKNTALTADNFQRSWDALSSFYENKRLLVNSALQTLFSIKKVSGESAHEIEYLYTSMMQVYRTMETLDRPIQHWSDLLVFMTVQRLDSESVKAWENCLGSSKEPATWDQVCEFLLTRMMSLQAVKKSQANRLSSNSKPGLRSHFIGQSTNSESSLNRPNSCILCSESHYLGNCRQYQNKSQTQRRDIVIANRWCFNCLGHHQVANCSSTKRCTKCGKRHHTSLHSSATKHQFTLKPDSQQGPVSSTAKDPKVINHAHSEQPHKDKGITLLATAEIRIQNQYGDTLKIRALLDQGSEVSLITESVVQRLSLPRFGKSLPIIGIGAQPSCQTRGCTTLNVSPHFDPSTTIQVTAHILSKLTASIPSATAHQVDWPHLNTLQLADPNFTTSGQIDMLIGADQYGQLLEGSVIKGSPNMPTAQLTTLGWIISGPTTESPQSLASQSFHSSIDHELPALLERFWQQEEICGHNIKTMSSTDQECENHFRSTHSRTANGRYVVRLPFKGPIQELGDSKRSALRMLHHLFSKFTSSDLFFESYSKFLNEYEALHHMIQVSMTDSDTSPAFYLPHHGVIRESSTTTKLRVVFNGSCKTTTGKPINELLHTGQKLQTDVFDVLLWIRKFKYLFAADIEKMYRQIKVHPHDWKFQRILWRTEKEIETYELTTVTYGMACAPFLALRCMIQLVKDEGHRFPLAVEVLNQGRYVDDVFGGADSIAEAQEIAHQVFELAMAGGFPLRKWSSNKSNTLNKIPVEYHTKQPSIEINDEMIHTLGLSWHSDFDTLHLKPLNCSMKTITKRSVLSTISQCFDPIGLLSPILIRSKVFLQELWALKLGWDDTLPKCQAQTWHRIEQSLTTLDSVPVPRWLGITNQVSLEVHGFCDASQVAIAAVIYLRIIDSSQSVNVTLVCSKTKVAPIKRMTIPRLELAGAVMVTKLLVRCCQSLNLSSAPCYVWTDSSIVNTWINNHPAKWKDYVHNRVCYIQETLPNARWSHIPGTENPADCATRGLTPHEIQTHKLWWHGPPWLAQQSSRWPASVPSVPHESAALEERTDKAFTQLCLSTQLCHDTLFDRYSSLNRLTRIIALCQRAITKFKGKPDIFDELITPAEILNAKKLCIKLVQQQEFHIDIKRLASNPILPNTSSLVRLTPFIDCDGLLRVGGRLQNAAIPYDTKHPYILPKSHHLSTLIINESHIKTLHGSTQETLAHIRNDYWIVGGRNPVRSHILKCVICTRYRQDHARQLMGQLPPSRVNPSRPFLHAGVDYAGPLSIKSWRGRSSRSYKAWVSLFVCHSTSAIHLELVTDYSANSFLAAYRRFTGRRGICATLSSDCGTNFQGADQELKKLFSNSSTELQKFKTLIANDGTSWKFNPPSAPHFGGKWEAGVKSMKFHLRRVIGTTLLTYEEMSTVLIQIESILNSRPMCPLTNDPDDLNVLTPAHFLIGQPLTLIPEPNLEHLQQSRLSRWQHLSQMIQSFWSKWSKEYLQRQLSIYKWNNSSHNLTPGTLVFIIDERYPPAKWALGRILQLHPGPDNRSRVATIKTSTTILKRPIVKLCPLHID